ncbi:MAG: efflux RND transporter periplasmic adaptor subunit [Bacteroidetes bacterium]|nr:efflux RND transporter periplasmic adaptor subunit [Bacteroidota bacterium]
MQKLIPLITLLLLVSCGKKDDSQNAAKVKRPSVSASGDKITFFDKKTADFFAVQDAKTSLLIANLTAPARVVATVVPSQENPDQNLVLFDTPEMTTIYTQLLQHLANINQIEKVTIKQRKIELERIKDLQQHGAAAGREVLEAQTALALEETNLINEKASNLENEAKLKLGGFNADALLQAQPKTVWVISDIPENQLDKINEGNKCIVNFISFPNESFSGVIDNIGDVIDRVTRLVKLRITIHDLNGKLKAGMFGTSRFGLSQGKFIAVPKEAIVTVMGKDYVFIKKSDLEFERKLVTTGQQADNNVLVYDGISDQDHVVIKGTMQLKGLSFGY